MTELSILIEEEFEGRPVKVEAFDDGGYRITTTSAEDYDGKIEVTDSSVLHIPPKAAGTPESDDAITLEDAKESLRTWKFTKATIDVIAARIQEAEAKKNRRP